MAPCPTHAPHSVGVLVAIRRDTARVYFFTRRLLGELLGTYRDMPVWRGCDLRGGSTARAVCGVRVPALFDAP